MASMIHEMFAQTAKTFPERIALSMNGKNMTYGELDYRSNEVANWLMDQRLPCGSVVGIELPRGFDLIAAIIGVLKAGHAYLPLDSEYPAERLSYMLENSKARCLIALEEKDSWDGATLLMNGFSGTKSDVKRAQGELCYVIYTSGSTGHPKGVAMGHHALANLVRWQSKICAGMKTLQFAPISFDVHFQEIFCTLISGATLVLVSEQTRSDFSRLLHLIDKENIERLFLPYVALNVLCQRAIIEKHYPAHLRYVATAGEQLKINQAIRDFFKVTKAKLSNQYGPSETHVVTCLELSSSTDTWEDLPSIGREIDGVELLVLDSNMNICEEGEVYVSGICLAQGYIHDEERTAQCFFDINGKRFYKTGDLARKQANGEYRFLSRTDGQIKIRGYRVELGEVEAAIQKCAPETQASVKVVEKDQIEPFLCAYIVGPFQEDSLRVLLKDSLPEYMLPRFYVSLEKFPLTPSGKVDRRALPVLQYRRPPLGVEYVPAGNQLEQQIQEIWKELLVMDEVGVNDVFFDLGASSLLAINLLDILNKSFQADLDITDIFDNPTIQSLARKISSGSRGDGQELRTEASLSPRKDVAIIAINGKFPKAPGIEDFWRLISEGSNVTTFFEKSSVHPSVSEALKNSANYVFANAHLEEGACFDAGFFGMTPLEAQLTDPQHRKFLEVCHEALEIAGVDAQSYPGRIGLYAGSAYNTYTKNLTFHKDKVNAFGDFNVMLGNDKDYLPSRVAYKLGLTGPAVSVNTGCSTSLVAIIHAVQAIRNGHCEIALAGGASVEGQRHKGYLHQEGSIYSQDGYCRPFDAQATGTVFSDGVAVVVLKDLELAKRDGDQILALVKGVGLNNDGSDKMSFSAPSVEGQKKAVKMAIQEAGISPRQIEFIEAHGTATPIGDPIEIKALTKAFRELGVKEDGFCALGSVKANIGHCTAAAGAAGLLKAVCSLHHGLAPGLANLDKVNPAIDVESSPFVISDRAVQLSSQKAYAGVSSFGVGGTNAHIILQGVQSDTAQAKGKKQEELFLLSAKSEEALGFMMADLDERLNGESHLNTAYSLLKRKERNWRAIRTSSGKWSKTSKIQNQSKLIFMFPGQGCQYPGMGRSLCDRFPSFKKDLDFCYERVSELLGVDFKAIVNSSEEKFEGQLNNTLYTQPAVFSFEYALGSLALRFGLKPDAYIGHSIGEFAAAVLAGIFDIEDAIQIVCKRSVLMSRLEQGVMLSVPLGREEVSGFLSEDIQIAALNGVNSTVVAGPFGAIKELEAIFGREGISCKRLSASHAFHSRMMEPMLGEFEDFISTFTLRQPQTPFHSTVTGAKEDDLLTRPSYWAKHVVNPVLFEPALRALMPSDADANGDSFVEIGPRATLKTLAGRAALAGKNKALCLALANPKTETEASSFLRGLGLLWSRGHRLEWEALFENRIPKRIPTTTHYFLKQKHWLDYPDHDQMTSEIQIINNYEDTFCKGQIMSESKKEKLRKQLVEVFEEASGVDLNEFSEDTCFLEMGLDSLFLTQISLKLKNTFGVDVGFRELTDECSDLNGLIQKLEPHVVEKVREEHGQKTALVQQVNTPPKTLSLPLSVGGGVEELITRQIELMKMQLAALGHQDYSQTSLLSENHASVIASKEKNHVAAMEPKVFGAMARITSKSVNGQNRPAYEKEFIQAYNEKTKGSKAFTQDHRRHHADPRAVTGFKPEIKEMVYPIVVEKSQGQRLVDIDGNEYVDMLCGFGSNFFGNGNKRIKAALSRQLEAGMEIGPQHPLTAQVARLINEITGNERSAFCNTGSEAVLGALRIARTYTGKKKIVSFANSYHGINDEVIARAGKGKTFPAAPGIMDESVGNNILLEYGVEDSLNEIEKLCQLGDLAAVLVEPVQSRRCDFHPKEFLVKLRELTEKYQVCLIFDEVITGFRVHPAGAQSYFQVRADLCVYGKVVGGGMPIGVISGRAKYMDALDGGFWGFGDDSVPPAGVTYFAGTFVRHPLALAAAKEALEILLEGGAARLDALNKRTEQWVSQVNDLCRKHNAKLKFVNFGSLLKPKYDDKEFPFADLFFAAMRFYGLHVYEGFPWFINLAHTEEDLAKAKDAVEAALTMMEAGKFEGLKQRSSQCVLGDIPPEPGARLGKDREGNPAWFIESSEKEGVYIQL